MSKAVPDFCYPPAEKLQNFFGVFLQFQIGVDIRFPKGTFKSITVDNGSEFQDADGIQPLTNALYYCHPYTSCERDSNENANRIIRRFLPKGRSMKNVKQKDCDTVAHYINNMHRKVLGYHTTAEPFQEELKAIQT